MSVPVTEAGAFDADWLLQPQGEARRLEATLASFAERGFHGSQYTARAIEVEGCPAYHLGISSQAGEWSPREWSVTGTVTVAGLWPGRRVYDSDQKYAEGPVVWTKGRTGESLFEGGARLRNRLELPMLQHLAVIGIRTVEQDDLSLPGDETWLPEGWFYEGGILRQCEGGTMLSEWSYSDDEYGVGRLSRTWSGNPAEPQRIALTQVGYHVAGKLAGVEDPHGVYMQRQKEFEAELAAAQEEE